MNIIQKVNSREFTPKHNNYQEVTVDAAGKGPVVDFSNIHGRTSGLAGFSPLKSKSWYDKFSDWGHLALDVAGMIPLVGVAADGINAAWYAGEGDWENAALSGLAAIPGAGQAATATKLARKGMKLGDQIVTSAKNNPISTGIDIAFGADMVQQDENVQEAFDFKPKFSPFFGNDKGKMFEGGPTAAIPLGFQKYYEYDAKDGKEGNVMGQAWDDIKGGVNKAYNWLEEKGDMARTGPININKDKDKKNDDKPVNNNVNNKKSNLDESWINAAKNKFNK
tara:strand:- start:2015 stop:2851 length:837 start_codon:yes stop_codon:yes gene_type:complete